MAHVGAGGRPHGPRGLFLPIDTERETGWVLVELLYCLQRDARRRWRARSRRLWTIVMWAISAAATSAGGVVADHNFHMLVRLLRGFGPT